MLVSNLNITKNETSACTAAPTTQGLAGIGHNRRQPTETIEPFGLRAAWLHFAKEVELRRLAKLQARINRINRRRSDLVSERQLIMARCIKRMRRLNGKN